MNEEWRTALMEWWEENNASDLWSGAIVNASWDDLTVDDIDALCALLESWEQAASRNEL